MIWTYNNIVAIGLVTLIISTYVKLYASIKLYHARDVLIRNISAPFQGNYSTDTYRKAGEQADHSTWHTAAPMLPV